MKAYRGIKRNYYKYEYTPNTTTELYNSNNTTYINSTSHHFIVNSVTAWSTTQTYKLTNPICAKDITAISTVTAIQGNCGWQVKVSCETQDGDTFVIFEKDHGYGVADTLEDTISFDTSVVITSITIYAYCYRRSSSYCYGSIDISLQYNKESVIDGTSADYDFYKDFYVYKAKYSNDKYKAITSLEKGQYCGS